MTTTKNFEPDVQQESSVDERIVAAGEVAAELLPSTSPLTAGLPTPPALLAGGDWAGGAVARLSRPAGGTVGVLVGRELVTALASSPMGELDLGAAVQPTLDAAAAALGATAEEARTLDPDTIAGAMADASAAVPLLAGTTTAAVVFGVLPSSTSAGSAQASRPSTATPAAARPGLEILHGVAMEVTVELGRTRMSVRDLLALTPGDVLELDRAAGSPADLLVNGRLIARGEVVVVDEDFALRVTEIVTTATSH